MRDVQVGRLGRLDVDGDDQEEGEVDADDGGDEEELDAAEAEEEGVEGAAVKAVDEGRLVRSASDGRRCPSAGLLVVERREAYGVDLDLPDPPVLEDV